MEVIQVGTGEDMSGQKFKDNLDRRSRMQEILDRLSSEFQLSWPTGRDPFLTLVATVLSQNTNSKNAEKAFRELASKFSSPADLSEADLGEIQEMIKPAGIYRVKSKKLRELARLVQRKHDGSLKDLLARPLEEARKELLSMPGVGPKTADCVLLFAGDRDVLPVDTHVARTAKRLGFAKSKDDPEKVKEKLERLLSRGQRGPAHLLLIELGRTYCRAINPRCDDCPIEDLCPKIFLNS